MAALGLMCVLASGSCWAQQSTSSTNGSAKPHAKAAAKPAAKATAKTASKKSADKPVERTAAKSSKAGRPVAAKDNESKDAAKNSPAIEPTQAAKADVKPEARTESRADAAPPAGTMMGAYGQSLMRAPAAATVATAAAAGTAAALAAAPANTAQASTAPVPPTAMMGAAGNASDSVARFLQQRGIVALAQGSQPDAGAQSATPGLLNQVRDKASDLVLSAMNFLGVPYKRGGNSVSNGFDCSGFTRHIFEMSVGLVLPRRADEQAKLSSLVSIRKEDLKPGDLVFFNTMRQTFSHVGIYVGEGKFIHSPRVGGAVRVEDMREAYWAKRFTGARRADLNQANSGT